eukprot:12420533-Karenia_brevis.AAC.1
MVMDKESDACHQHRIAMQSVEMVEEGDEEQDEGPLTPLDPAELSDLPPSAYGCFENCDDFARACMAGRKQEEGGRSCGPQSARTKPATKT